MTESKKNIEITNGWILCPSKSFPGKFYYFNVLNGEAAWSLNQSDNKGFLKERSFDRIADKYHGYPEPTTLPDNIFTDTKKLDCPQNFPHNRQLPKFGQASFPNYVTNAEPVNPNTICTSVASLKLSPETEKPMFDQKLSEFEHHTISQYSKQTNIPISKRFTNYQKPCFSSYRHSKIVKPISKFETSTPKNLFLECASESQNFFPKLLIKKSTLKLNPKSLTPKCADALKSNEKAITSFSKVESTKSSAEIPKFVEKEENLENLDSSDLRFLLLAKRRSTDAADIAVERKKPKPNESKPPTLKKKVTFNIKDETDDDNTANDIMQQDFIPLTSNLTRTILEAPKSPVLLRDKTPPSFLKVSPKTPPPNVEDQPPTANYQRPTCQPTANYQWPPCQPTAKYQPSICQPTANYQRPTLKNTTWYLVVDTDVLLLDYEFIDKVVLSDRRCRLIIPRAVAADIEELCLGDCHGQQRVITARKLTRKLAKPPPHYIVEPRTKDSGNTCHYMTTDSILHCCLKVASKNYYVGPALPNEYQHCVLYFDQQWYYAVAKVPSNSIPTGFPLKNDTSTQVGYASVLRNLVLITNDPHLQIRATLLSIQSYKLNELKYGADIRPKKKIFKMITPNDDLTDSNRFHQGIFRNLEIKPDITSDEKNMKINSRNYDIDGKHQYNNHSLFSYHASPIKKQLFLSDSDSDSSLDCDELITSQTKKLKNIQNNNKPDFDVLSDISSEVSSLNLTDNFLQKRQNVGRNPFLPQNVKENGFVDFGKRILSPNIVFNDTISIRRTIPNKKPSPENRDFQKDNLEYNFENTESPFSSTPITNMNLFDPKSKFESSIKPVPSNTCLSSRQEPFGVTRDNKILNPSQARIQKIIRTINNDSTSKNQLDNHLPKTKDATGLFKIPQLLPVKNATRYTSVDAENSTVNDRICTRTNIDSIDENLTRFRIKSKNMKFKIKTRIDEWICSYMQIMEDALMHILQKNCVCMENTVAPLTLKDTLNCIKMLFGSHKKIRDFTNKLSELLEKCMLCTQGKSKMSLIPEDFMKIFGYGVLLVQALKNIHPQSRGLNEAELRLNNLQIILESNTKEFDPELVKSPSLSKSDVDQGLEENRPQFIKNKSYVIDYLKKHFKEWETYTEDLDDQNHKIEKHTDFKVVRTIGKNLNLLKIDSKKKMTLSKNTLEDELANRSKDKSRLIRLLENNQIIKPKMTENVKINTKNETKLMGRGNNENNQSDFDYFLDENENKNDKDVPLKKLVDNIDKGHNNESKVDKEFNYKSHENSFVENTERDGPKIIRNAKLNDELEKKFNKNKEPLDLDLFYSEIYEPYVGENIIDFEVISEKNKNSQEINKNNNFEDNNNYGLDNTMCTLEDFYITPSISPDSKNSNNTTDFTNAENSSYKNNETKISENITSHYFNSVPEKNNRNAHIEKKIVKNDCEVESETFTENQDSHEGNGNSGIHIDNSKTLNNDSGTHLDNSDNSIGKTAQIVRDDSTNDSGFENDSTYAHSLIKMFLNELSTTFKVIHTFVTEFIDEIRETELSGKRKDTLHNQASKVLEDMVAITQHLRSIIKRESSENTVLKTLLRNAGVEATTDKRMTRYKQIVIKCLEQALILECALKVIVSTTMDDFEALSSNAEILNSSLRYFNIFELD